MISFMPGTLHPRGKGPWCLLYWRLAVLEAGWLGTRAGPDTVENRKIFARARNRTAILHRPIICTLMFRL
jgi:hypothetical protein